MRNKTATEEITSPPPSLAALYDFSPAFSGSGEVGRGGVGGAAARYGSPPAKIQLTKLGRLSEWNHIIDVHLLHVELIFN
jgi:hypothetical protein